MYRAVNLTSKPTLENMKIKHILPQAGDLISPVLVMPGAYLTPMGEKWCHTSWFCASGLSQNERTSRKSAVKDCSMGGRPPLRTLQPQDRDTETHACSLGTCPLHDRAPILVSHSLCDELKGDQHVPGHEFEVETYPRKHENKTFSSRSWRCNLSCFVKTRGILDRPWVGSGVILPAFIRAGRTKMSENL